MTRNSFGCTGPVGDPRKRRRRRLASGGSRRHHGQFERAYASSEINLGEVAHDDLAIDVLDALAVESDPRTQRMLDLMRERGWAGWTRPERLAEPPG